MGEPGFSPRSSFWNELEASPHQNGPVLDLETGLERSILGAGGGVTHPLSAKPVKSTKNHRAEFMDFILSHEVPGEARQKPAKIAERYCEKSFAEIREPAL